MKNSVKKNAKTPLINLMVMLLVIMLASCSADEPMDDPLTNINISDVKIHTVDDQLMHLTQKVQRFHNFKVAIAQGYDVNLVYMPNMGDHFSDTDLIDDHFDYLNPEVLIYIINDAGEREFVGVEYLVAKTSDTPPEGFIGDDDVWADLGTLWALHAWVVMENPDGVFHPTNVNITY